MGIGVVLLVWFAIGTVIAAIGGAALGVVAYVVRRRSGRRAWPWVLAFAAAPFAFLVYLFVAYGVYAVWCDAYRGVDPGIGDSWRVPLQNGYAFEAIDTYDQSFIESPGRHTKHLGLVRIGQSGDLIFGSEPAGFFLINTRTGSDSLFSSETEFRQALRASGATSIAVEEPSAFYSSHRWTAEDAVAFAIILAFPVLCALCALFVSVVTK